MMFSKRSFNVLSLLFIVFLLSMGSARADTVSFDSQWTTHTDYGSPVDQAQWDDYFVEYSSGIYAFGSAWTNSDTRLGWDIDFDSGLYTYTYSWTDCHYENGTRDLIIELTNGIPVSNVNLGYGRDPFDGSQTGTFTQGDFANLPYDIYGIGFWDGGRRATNAVYNFSFQTVKAPVWGNFFADGSYQTYSCCGGWINHDLYAFNTGFSDPTGGIFIARPDGSDIIPPPVIPEPTSLLLLGTGLGILYLGKSRRSKK